MISGHATTGVHHFFLMTTTLTSVAGFLLPADQLQPSHILGVLSLVAFATARLVPATAKNSGRLAQNLPRRGDDLAYFNVFVSIAQSVMKVPGFHELARSRSAPPFAVAQGLNFVLFIIFTAFA